MKPQGQPINPETLFHFLQQDQRATPSLSSSSGSGRGARGIVLGIEYLLLGGWVWMGMGRCERVWGGARGIVLGIEDLQVGACMWRC